MRSPTTALTPLHAELALHYLCRADDHPNLGAPAVNQYLGDLVREGLLRCHARSEDPQGYLRRYSGTPLLWDYVRRVLDVPLVAAVDPVVVAADPLPVPSSELDALRADVAASLVRLAAIEERLLNHVETSHYRDPA